MTMGVPITERTFIGKVFLSPNENRLRAGWRLALQTALMLFIGISVDLGLAFVPFFGLRDPNSLARSIFVETVMITLSVFLASRWLDRRPFASLGLVVTRRMVSDVLVGILITLILMGLMFLWEYALGWLTIDRGTWQVVPPGTLAIGLATDLVSFIFIGWNEELLSRGYHLHTLASGLNLFWGVIVSSFMFAILHLGNPNAGNVWMVTLGIAAAGFFLAYAFLRTGQLWLSIGLHIGWNFFEGPIFSFPVSGTTSFQLLQTTVKGPPLWTGGAFGPEAGLIVFPVLALGIILIYWLTRGRQAVKKIE